MNIFFIMIRNESTYIDTKWERIAFSFNVLHHLFIFSLHVSYGMHVLFLFFGFFCLFIAIYWWDISEGSTAFSQLLLY